MPTLQDYLARSVPKEKRDRIHLQHRQFEDLYRHPERVPYFPCGCGEECEFLFGFRCFYCGEWYCETCARQHFHFSEYHGLDELLPGFLTRMQAELHGPGSQVSWTRWKPTEDDLIAEVLDHAFKLRDTLVYGRTVHDSHGKVKTVAELCADLANFAMKGFERFGERAGTKPPPPTHSHGCPAGEEGEMGEHGHD